MIESFLKGVDRESFVLKENPELVYPRLYHYFYSQANTNKALLNITDSGFDKYKKPWLRILSTKKTESKHLIRTFSGHMGVIDCAFKNNGTQIISVGSDKTIRKWDVKSGKEISCFILKGLNFNINYSSISLDKSLIVTCGGRFEIKGSAFDISLAIKIAPSFGEIKIWDVEKSKEIVSITNITNVGACALSPDSKQVICALHGRILRIWDSYTGNLLMTFKGLDGEVNSCVFSPDGDKILFAIDDGTLQLWNIRKRKEVATLKSLHNSIKACAFSPDGKKIVTFGDKKKLELLDAKKLKRIKTFEIEGMDLNSCNFSPDSKKIVACGSNIKVWKLNSGKEIANLGGHTGTIIACCFSHNGMKMISACSNDNSIKLWDIESSEKEGYLKDFPYRVQTCNFSPDGDYIISGVFRLHKLMNARTLEVLATFKDSGWGYQSVFSPDGTRIIIVSYKKLKLRRIPSGKRIKTLRGHSKSISAYCFSPCGMLIASGSEDGIIRIWDGIEGKKLTILNGHSQKIINCAFSSDSKKLASIDTKTLKVWDIEKCSEILTSDCGHISSIAFSPDGKKLVYTSGKDLIIRSTTTLRKTGKFAGHNEDVSFCVFSPDGKKILSISRNRNLNREDLKIWDAEKETLIVDFDYKDYISAKFSPEGNKIAILDSHSLKIFNVNNGNELAIFKGYGIRTEVFAFSPDGHCIVIGDAKGMIHLISLENF